MEEDEVGVEDLCRVLAPNTNILGVLSVELSVVVVVELVVVALQFAPQHKHRHIKDKKRNQSVNNVAISNN